MRHRRCPAQYSTSALPRTRGHGTKAILPERHSAGAMGDRTQSLGMASILFRLITSPYSSPTSPPDQLFLQGWHCRGLLHPSGSQLTVSTGHQVAIYPLQSRNREQRRAIHAPPPAKPLSFKLARSTTTSQTSVDQLGRIESQFWPIPGRLRLGGNSRAMIVAFLSTNGTPANVYDELE